MAPGWEVVGECTGGGLFVRRHGVTLLAKSGQHSADSAVQAGALTSVRFPAESRYAMPGFYLFFSDFGACKTQSYCRLYLNLVPELVAPLARQLLGSLLAEKLAYTLKVANDPNTQWRPFIDSRARKPFCTPTWMKQRRTSVSGRSLRALMRRLPKTSSGRVAGSRRSRNGKVAVSFSGSMGGSWRWRYHTTPTRLQVGHGPRRAYRASPPASHSSTAARRARPSEPAVGGARAVDKTGRSTRGGARGAEHARPPLCERTGGALKCLFACDLRVGCLGHANVRLQCSDVGHDALRLGA
jgi:hypothetical protein